MLLTTMVKTLTQVMVESEPNSPTKFLSRRMVLALLKRDYELVYSDTPRLIKLVVDPERQILISFLKCPIVVYNGDLEWSSPT